MKDYSGIYQQLLLTIFWVGACFGFVADEIFTGLAPYRSAVFLMLDALWLVLACCTVRRPLHVAGIAIFAALAYYSTCVANGESLAFWFNGMRDFFGLLLAFPVISYFMAEPGRCQRFLDTMDRHLFAFMGVQAVCVTWQFVSYGAGDHCGGSFGNWYSGQVSMCLYAASFFLIHRRVDSRNLLASLRDNWMPIALLFPTFLNETKVSFVLIVIYFFLLMPLDRRYLLRVMQGLPVVMLLGWGALMVYTSIVRSGDDILSMDYIESYFLKEDIDEAESGALWEIEQGRNADVPRFTKLMYLPILHEQESGHEMMGWGAGQFKGGTGMEQSDLANRYDWLLSGSIPYVFHVHIQLGIIGVIAVALWLALLFIVKPRWAAGRDLNMQFYVLCSILIIFLYNDSLRDLWMCTFLFLLLVTSYQPADEEDTPSEPSKPSKLSEFSEISEPSSHRQQAFLKRSVL